MSTQPLSQPLNPGNNLGSTVPNAMAQPNGPGIGYLGNPPGAGSGARSPAISTTAIPGAAGIPSMAMDETPAAPATTTKSGRKSSPVQNMKE
jgi:hypothetical protein